jgi:hypothetical protein
MKFHSTDIGYCRVYWKHGRGLYCLQEEFQGVYEFYSCTPDGEPNYPVPLEGRVFEPISNPDDYEAGFNAYLKEKGVLLDGK